MNLKTRSFPYPQFESASIYVHFVVALNSLIIIPLAAYILPDTQLSPSLIGYLISGKSIFALATSYLVRQKRAHDLALMKFFLLLLSVLTFLFTRATSFEIMFVYQSLMGCCCGAISVMNFNDVVSRSKVDDRKKKIGSLLSCYPLSLAIGVSPLIFIAGNYGWRVSLQLLAMLTLLGLVSVFFRQVPASVEFSEPPATTPMIQPVSWFDFVLCCSTIFMCVFSTFLFSVQLPTFLLTQLHIPSYLLSISYVIGGLGCFITVRRYTKKQNTFLPIRNILLASVAVSVLAVLVFCSQQVYVAAASFILFVLISASRTLVVKTDILHQASEGLRTLMVGTQGGVQYVAMALAGSSSSLILASGNDGLNYSLLAEIGVATSLFVPILCVVLRCRYNKKPSDG